MLCRLQRSIDRHCHSHPQLLLLPLHEPSRFPIEADAPDVYRFHARLAQ